MSATDTNSLTFRLARALRSPAFHVAALPGSAIRLLGRSPHTVGLDDLVEVASSDAAIAAAVMRALRTPLLGTSGRNFGIVAALARLGTREGYRVVVAGALSRIFVAEPPFRAFVGGVAAHGAPFARLAADIAELCGLDRNIAYVAALLSDVGIPPLVAIASEMVEHEDRDPAFLVGEIIAARWTASAMLLTEWRLAKELVEPIEALARALPANARTLYASVLDLADISVNHAGRAIYRHAPDLWSASEDHVLELAAVLHPRPTLLLGTVVELANNLVAAA